MRTKQNTFFCRTRRFKEADKHAYLYGVSLSEGPSTNKAVLFVVTLMKTDMHIFWDCPHTQTFWIEFSNVINRNVLQGFSLLFKDVAYCLASLTYKKIK